MTHQPSPEIDVLFHLPRGEEAWPPFPAETVRAHLDGPDRARLVGIPMYADGLSRGDTVAISRDGAGFVGGAVVDRGRHTTVRVAATDVAQLETVSETLGSAGVTTLLAAHPPLLAVDVAATASLEDVLVRLDQESSMTLTYVVSCLQHRIAPSTSESTGESVVAASCALDAVMRGRVVRPEDPEWEVARSAWNLAVDQRPALVAEVADAFDVQAVVRYAAENGLRVAPQSTGHNASPLTDLSDAVLLRTARMAEIEVDPDGRSVRVGAGALWADVTEALAPYGLAALAGSSPDVGVAGYTLGGGYSWLGRRYGLAASSVTAVELVTADGVFRRVDAENEPELFWAVRGGGANVGVVCALEMDVLPIAEVYAGALFFPIARAREILAAYELWSRDLDEAVTSCVRFLRFPPLPELPEPLRGNAFMVVDGAIDEETTRAERLLTPLRELGPVMDTWGPLPVSLLSTIHMDPPAPVPGVGDGLALVDLTPEVIDVLVGHAGPDSGSALLAVDIRHGGGALGRRDPRGGAVDHLPGRFLLFAVGMAVTPEVADVLHHQVAALIDDLQPWADARDYANFREVPVAPTRLFAPGELAALRRLREEHDPRGLLVANHPVG